jgi:hypothetical protein
MDRLKQFGLVYLGTPYTKYYAGIEWAFADAARLAAAMMRRGIKVYSPIAHTHPLARFGNIDPLDHSIWLPFDAAMMDRSDAMAIGTFAGWQQSYGVQHEIEVFQKAGKPVFRVDPWDFLVTEHISRFAHAPLLDPIIDGDPRTGEAV